MASCLLSSPRIHSPPDSLMRRTSFTKVSENRVFQQAAKRDGSGRGRAVEMATVAERVGVAPITLRRWLLLGKVGEVARDRNGWRVFTNRDVNRIRRFASKTVRHINDFRKTIARAARIQKTRTSPSRGERTRGEFLETTKIEFSALGGARYHSEPYLAGDVGNRKTPPQQLLSAKGD